ncbi:MAG: hypothetical protein FWH43_07180 [Endomicrobia bacterium]|nr:hypothetical protein [Endomicrobiia bacterium]
MVKKLLISPIFIFFAGIACAGTIGNYVYGVYGEIFPGAEYSGSTVDKVTLQDWNQQWGPQYAISTNYVNPLDGAACVHSPSGAAWVITFDAPQDMSFYYNGTLEVYVRGANGVNIGNIQIGIIVNGVNCLKTLSSAGITTANGNWQKAVIDLNTTLNAVVTFANMQAGVSYLFFIDHGANPDIDIGQVIWKQSPNTAAAIGDDQYSVYSENIPGASGNATNANRIQRIDFGSVSDHADNTAHEGVEYLKTDPSLGSFGFRFVDTGNTNVSQDMSQYYNGTLEAHIKIPGSSATYGSIEVGIITAAGTYTETLSNLAYTASGAWEKVTIPLNSSGLPGLNSAAALAGTQFLFYMVGNSFDAVEIDNIVWNKFTVPPANIGKDEYGVYSEAISGASLTAVNEDRVFRAGWQAGSTIMSSTASYEGNVYLRSESNNNGAGNWGIHFSSTNNAVLNQDMSAYYNGAIEMYIRVSTASVNYSNIRIGIQAAGQKFRSLSDLGYQASGQWQRVTIPLDTSLGGLTSANLISTQYLLLVETHSGYNAIDIDHVVWKSSNAVSAPHGNKAGTIYGAYSDTLLGTGAMFGTPGLDYVSTWDWGGTGNAPVNTVDGTAFEGSNYYKSPTTGGWGIFFLETSTQSMVRSMSEFYNGTLEFYVRAASGANLSGVEVGMKCDGANRTVNLSGSGTGNWEKVSIPLNAAGFSNLTRAIMLETTEILFFMNNNGVAVDVDNIVWKKANYVESAPEPGDGFGADIYGMYSEVYSSSHVVVGSNSWVNVNSWDNAIYGQWNGANGGNWDGVPDFVNVTYMSDNSSSKDGSYFGRLTAYGGGGWSVFCVTFKDGANADMNTNDTMRDMSVYTGGAIEFWARTQDSSMLNAAVGLTDSGGDKTVSLSSLGLTADGKWQKITVNISSLTALGANLYAVKNPFLIATDNLTGTLDIDQVVWRKNGVVVPMPSNIGNDIYGVYSETYEGVLVTDPWNSYNNINGTVFTYGERARLNWSVNSYYTISPSTTTGYEGNSYISNQNPASGFWGICFSSANNTIMSRDMSAYYGGTLELYVRVSTAASNYSTITLGIQHNNGGVTEKTKSLADLGYTANGQWQRVVLKLDSSMSDNSLQVSSADLANTRYLFLMGLNNNDVINIDHVVWRKTPSEPHGNKADTVYKVYSDWLIKGGAEFSTPNSVDNVNMWFWGGAGVRESSATTLAFEGYNYYISSGAGGWGILFTTASGGADIEKPRSMSEYFNGTLEFYVRGANIGAAEVGIKFGGSDIVRTLSSLGITGTSGRWKKVEISLNADSAKGLSQLTNAVLLESTSGLFRLNNNGAEVDVDHIVWKRADAKTPAAANVNLKLKNRTDNSEAGIDGKITWDSEKVIKGSTKAVVSDQYIELQLSDWFPGDDSAFSWGLQMYTDNDIASAALSSFTYTGEMTTDTVSGLVGNGRNNVYVPMQWRAANKLFSLPEPSDPAEQIMTWEGAWSPMRDRTAGSFYYDRSDVILLCDKRGYKYALYNDFGEAGYDVQLAEDRKIYLYFSCDSFSAQRGYVYRNEAIVIELFYE